MNLIKNIIITTIFLNIIFFNSMVFAEEKIPIATVDDKYCYTLSDITKNCKDGSIVTFLDDINYSSSRIRIPNNNILITSNGLKTIQCDFLESKGNIKLENINLITHDNIFNIYGNNIEIGKNVSIQSSLNSGIDLFSGKETIIRSNSFDEIFGGLYEGITDHCFILIDNTNTKIEQINGTYNSNVVNNFKCQINNGYVKNIHTKNVKQDATIILNGGTVDNITYGTANNANLILDNYNNVINSLKYDASNPLKINIKNGNCEIKFLPDKFNLIVDDNAKIIINGKTYFEGIYEINSLVDNNEKVNRGMAIDTFYNSTAKNSTTNINVPFKDISINDIYYPSIQWAYDKGIISKSFDNKFRPNDNITKEEFAVILYKYLKYIGFKDFYTQTNKISNYTDFNDISPWALDSINYMVDLKIYNVDSNNAINPKNEITKSELAVILKKYNSLINCTSEK